jgi:hypothetical protein
VDIDVFCVGFSRGTVVEVVLVLIVVVSGDLKSLGLLCGVRFFTIGDIPRRGFIC